MATFSCVGILKDIHALFRDGRGLDEHWVELTNLLTQYGLTADREECRLAEKDFPTMEFDLVILAHGQRDFPTIGFYRSEDGWIVSGNEGQNYVFIADEDRLYAVGPNDERSLI